MAAETKKIQIKRGLSSKVPQLVLDAGEPAVALDTGKLYIGDGAGNVVLLNPDQAAAETAVKLQTPRTIGINGDGTATSGPFDGSANVTMTLVLANTGVAAGTYTKLTIDAKGRVLSAAQQTAADIPNLTLSKITDAGTAASKNTGTAAGNVVVVESGGKINPGILPALAITQPFPVSSQAAMLALDAQIGDVAIRSDVAKNYILQAEPASTLANWLEFLVPAGAVSSVAGRTGAVTLAKGDVGLGSVENYGLATQAEAEAGTSAAKYMTPQRVAQAITAQTAVIDGGTF